MEKIRITETRSPHEDDVHVNFALKVGDQEIQTLNRHIGNRNDGTYAVDLAFTQDINGADIPLLFNYQVVNKGHGGTTDQEIEKALNDGAHTLAVTLAGTGNIWASALTEFFAWLGGFLNPNCDGPLAADQISVTAKILSDWTSQTGVHSEERFYRGKEASVECTLGRVPSQYYVTWSVRRVGPIGPGNVEQSSREGSQTFAVGDQQHYLGRTEADLRHWWWEPSGGLHRDTWGKDISGVPVTLLIGDAQHAFARGTDGSLKHWWWSPKDGMRSDTWGTGVAGDPAAILIGNQQHVFAIGSNGELQHWSWSPDTGIRHDSWGR